MSQSSSTTAINWELALDGVYYASVIHAGRPWRVGSVTPDWRAELARISVDSTGAVTAPGVWAAPETAPSPLAAVCCGLGSSWPGMGRGLYENFPAARAAMEELAAIAGWDILSLLDITDQRQINETRKQIPYLFMLEYAQWKQLVSLGFKPDILCGHSLGELIALCFAGVFSPAAAWYLLDTRAEHVAELEARSSRQSGMLAISADYSVVREVLAAWPGTFLSNANAPRQYVLSGPRDVLADARKALRRGRIPAFLLNVDLAFHNPAMRVLRDLSYRRLRALQTRPPRVPLLSCVTAELYPEDQDGICRAITDLDENAVLWSKSLAAMREKFAVGAFVEFGPAETLCGLCRDNDETAPCVPCDKKNHETEAMREACAKLFAAGYLRPEALKARKKTSPKPASGRVNAPRAVERQGFIPDDEARAIIELLAKASGVVAEEIRPEQDLRYDLALRSSNFPWLLQEAERVLGRSTPLENIFVVNTVGDLVRALKGEGVDRETGGETEVTPDFYASPIAPLARFAGENPLVPAPAFEFSGARALNMEGRKIALVCRDPELAGLWLNTAALGATLVVFDETAANALEARGATVERASATPGNSDSLLYSLKTLGAFDYVFLELDPADEKFERALAACARYASDVKARLITASRIRSANPEKAVELALKARGVGGSFAVVWIDERENTRLQNSLEGADLLARELERGKNDFIVWRGADNPPPVYDASSPKFRNFFPDASEPGAAAFYRGFRHFSLFASPPLGAYGASVAFPAREPGFPGEAALSPGVILGALLEGAEACVPWLTIAGISDFRVFTFPALPKGVTRECKVTAKAGSWLSQYGVPARLCRIRADVFNIEANGRRKGAVSPLAECECQMTAKVARLEPLWREKPKTAPVAATEEFYEAMGMGEEWRFLTDVSAQKKGAQTEGFFLSARTRLPESLAAAIASVKFNWYNNLLCAIDAVFQAAYLSLALDGETGFSARRAAGWRFRSAGFIRFDFPVEEDPGDLRLEARQSWKAADLIRFDAQAFTRSGAVALTVTHLEFDRVNA